MIVPDLKTKKSYTLKVKTNSLFCGDFDMLVFKDNSPDNRTFNKHYNKKMVSIKQ